MKILIERYQKSDKQTIGRFHLLNDDNHIKYTWDSLELPWKGNKKRVSCVKEGKYKAIVHNSPKFGKTLWLQDVEGRSEILVHKGNFFRDILGCILIGTDLKDIDKDGYIDVINSGKAMSELMSMIENISEIEIEITSI